MLQNHVVVLFRALHFHTHSSLMFGAFLIFDRYVLLDRLVLFFIEGNQFTSKAIFQLLILELRGNLGRIKTLPNKWWCRWKLLLVWLTSLRCLKYFEAVLATFIDQMATNNRLTQDKVLNWLISLISELFHYRNARREIGRAYLIASDAWGPFLTFFCAH